MTKHRFNPSSVVKVGDGRGFVIEHHGEVPTLTVPSLKLPALKLNLKRRRLSNRFMTRRLVVTAAHCLPNLPPPIAFRTAERTYMNLLGNLDGSKSNVWAECCFVNPVADIAVLGCVDGQELSAQADAYDDLIEETPALRIANARNGRGWMLELSGKRWVPTPLKIFTGWWSTSLNIGPTKPGMSGSPILNDDGRAVGVVAIGISSGRGGVFERDEYSGPQPILTLDLPGWLLGRGNSARTSEVR